MREQAEWQAMRRVWLTAAATVLVDQASKFAVVQGLELRQRLSIDVLPPWLNFRMAWNRGVNFGLFAGDGAATRWLLVAVALAIAVAVVVWMWRDRQPPVVQVAAGLLVGGALGNVIDRLFYGAVADFLNTSCCGLNNPFSFNVADIAVFVGAAGLVLFSGHKKTP